MISRPPLIVQIILSQEPDPEDPPLITAAKQAQSGDELKYISEARVVPRR